MDSRALLGMWYTAEALDDNDLRAGYETYEEDYFDFWYDLAGYTKHGSGFDASYEGISLYYLTWLTLVSGDEDLEGYIQGISKLKGYLTLPENDGVNFWGPSHFNTATGAGSPNDQWYIYRRDAGAAMISDDAKYLVWGGRARASYRNHDLETVATMKSEISSYTTYINGYTGKSYGLTESVSETPPAWAHTHWGSTRMGQAAEYYQAGSYSALSALESGSSPLMQVHVAPVVPAPAGAVHLAVQPPAREALAQARRIEKLDEFVAAQLVGVKRHRPSCVPPAGSATPRTRSGRSACPRAAGCGGCARGWSSA